MKEATGHIRTIYLQGSGNENVLTHEEVSRIIGALKDFDRDRRFRTAVLTSKPGVSFGAGAGERHLSGHAGCDFGEAFIYQPLKPVVGAMRGNCTDEALMIMARATDLRVAAHGAIFGFPALKHSSALAAARSGLAGQIPYTALMWLLMTGEVIDAREAARIGLITHAVSDDELEDASMRLAGEICALSPFGARGEKDTLLQSMKLNFDQGFFYAVTTDMLSHISPDGIEGINAFVEKREPRFYDFDPDE